MNTAAQWYIDRQMQQVSSDCQMAISGMRRARTILELVRANHVHVPSYLHSLVQRDVARVERTLEERGKEIIDAQLLRVAGLPLEERAAEISRLHAHEWRYLRGHLPRECRRVEIESAKLLRAPTSD